MKAARLTAIERIEIVDVPDLEAPRPGWVEIRVEAVGICGSDVHYYRTGRIGDQVVQFPFTLGHEGAGTISSVGDGVDEFAPGDRVAFDPAMPCFVCDQCRKGRHHTCRHTRFLGCPGQAEGCLSERLSMPASSCFRLPESLNFEDGALSEPLSIGVYAARLARIGPGARVAVQGAGPIGLCVTTALLAEAVRVGIVEPLADRREFAKRFDVDWVAEPAAASEHADGDLDAVFECCGQQEALDQAIEMLTPGGKLVIVGIPEGDRVSFDAHRCRRKEVAIQNVRRQVDCVERALEGIATGDYAVAPMVTHRFGLEATAAAFELVAGYRDGVIKAVVAPSG